MLFKENLHVLNDFLDEYWEVNPDIFFSEFNFANGNSEYFDIFRDSVDIIRDINYCTEIWDKLSILCEEERKLDLISLIKKFSSSTPHEIIYKKDVENLYLLCIRLFYEVDFRNIEKIANSTILNSDSKLDDFKRNTSNYLKSQSFSSSFSSELAKITYFLSYELAKRLYHSEEISLFHSFDKKVKKVKEDIEYIERFRDETHDKINNFKSELDEKESAVKQLNSTLEKQETAFNFVGLYKGFNGLAKQKKREATNTFYFLIVLAFALVAFPLYATLSLSSVNNFSQNTATSTHLLNLLPLISLELILIYFFRVVLHNYKSTKAQVLQVELRQTLCQFIQNYADYSKEIKKDDPTVLEKFENLIFSGIISDAENLPSTFDGMDQITKLLTSLKGKQ